MGELGIYIFPRALASPRPTVITVKPNCHTLRDHNPWLRHAKQHDTGEEAERLSRGGMGGETASIPGGGGVLSPYVSVGVGEVAGAGGEKVRNR
jgi:hypothetical protein